MLPRTLLVAGAAVLLLAGCGRRNVVGSEIMRAESEPRALDRILLAQAIAGAGEDRMLYSHHFDGRTLNSLGRSKLRLMLEDAAFLSSPDIYIVTGENAHMSAVQAYLGEWGLAAGDTRLHAGLNPDLRRLAARDLALQQRFEETELRPAGADGAAAAGQGR